MSDIKTFEQRMREHRQQYEQQRSDNSEMRQAETQQSKGYQAEIPGSNIRRVEMQRSDIQKTSMQPAEAQRSSIQKANKQAPEVQRSDILKTDIKRMEKPTQESLKIEIDLDDMYLHEKEDDKYIVVDYRNFEEKHMDMDSEAGFDTDAEMDMRGRVADTKQERSSMRQSDFGDMHATGQPIQSEMRPRREPVPSGARYMYMPDINLHEVPGGSPFSSRYLQTRLGEKMRVEFQLGTGGLKELSGVLVDVGASHIVLESADGTSHTICDIHSIKFITIMKGYKMNNPMGSK